MTKKDIKKLAEWSYTKENLDQKKARKITKLLGKSDLKLYIKALKNIESKKVVRIVVPDKKMIDINMLKQFQTAFPKKRIEIEEDSGLILGIKIVDNDLIYQLNLKNTLDNLSQYLVEQYD